MPPSDPVFVEVPADVWTPVVVNAVSVVVNILEAFADVVYYQTYRLTGQSAPGNTANPGDDFFEGIAIFNRRDRIAGKDVFVGGVEFKTTEGVDVYIYPLGKAGKVRVDSLAAGNGGGAVTSVDTRIGDVTLDDLYEPVFNKNTAFNKNFGSGAGQVAEGNALAGKENSFSKNTAFNKNFGSGAGQVAEGNALAAKMTGPGSSQINEIFVAVDANGNAQIVPVKIDPLTRKVSLMGDTEQDGSLYVKNGEQIGFTDDGLSTGAKSGQLFGTAGGMSFKFANVSKFTYSATDLVSKIDHTFQGDVKTVAWTDYGGTSTIAGFSSVTIKNIWYKKVGKLVFVNYLISGTSNATNFTFTLPFTSKNSANFAVKAASMVKDNGFFQTNSGQSRLQPNSDIVTAYQNWSEGLWTAGGIKRAEGQFWYETT